MLRDFFIQIGIGTIIGFVIGVGCVILIDAKAIINDTIKNPDTGRWSRKNWTGIICMIFAMGYCIFATIHDKPIQEFVVAIFVSAALTCLGLSSWEKANLKPKDPTNE